MTPDLFIIILSIIIAVIFVFVLPGLIKWAAKKWKLDEIFFSSERLMTLIGLIVNASSASESSKLIVNSIITCAKKAVEYAEQLYLNNSITAGERKEKAIEYVKLALEEMGIEITDSRLQLIISTIEASVYELPSTHGDLS